MAEKVKVAMISYHPAPRPAGMSKRDAARCLYSGGFLPVEDLPASRIARGISKYAWAPAQFREGKRCKSNFARAQWLGLDFDSGEMTLDDALNSFCDVIHVIGTTESHRIAKGGGPAVDRFRVLLKLNAPVEDLRTYEHQLKLLCKRYPVDHSCLEAARFFFACKEIVSFLDDGETWDLVPMSPQDLEKATRPERRAVARIQSGVINPYILSLLRNGKWPEGQKNTLCFRIGAELGPRGYDAHSIMQMIQRSPEYAGRSLSADLAQEIETAVKNGMKRGCTDVETLRHGEA